MYPAAVEAAVRAGISRVVEGSFQDRRMDFASMASVESSYLPPLAEVIAKLPGLRSRTQRMLRIGGVALAGMCAGAQSPAPPPLLLALPIGADVPRGIIEMLALQAGVGLEPSASRWVPGGRATSLSLLLEAKRMIDAGVPEVIVGGIDSYIDLRVLSALSLEDRLTTEQQSDGFAPGEGAAFVLIAGRRQDGVCTLEGIGSGREEGTRDSDVPYRGEGLARAFAELGECTQAPAQAVYTSFNGERYWTRELGVAVLRSRELLEDGVSFEHPAQVFGDLGAATGVSLLALACEQVRRGGLGCGLVYASSDTGERSAVTLRK